MDVVSTFKLETRAVLSTCSPMQQHASLATCEREIFHNHVTLTFELFGPYFLNTYLNPISQCDISVYLRMADNKSFNHIQSQSHCLSHLLPPEKHPLRLRPRGHSYALPICPNNLCKHCFIPRCLFCFFVINV